MNIPTISVVWGSHCKKIWTSDLWDEGNVRGDCQYAFRREDRPVFVPCLRAGYGYYDRRDRCASDTHFARCGRSGCLYLKKNENHKIAIITDLAIYDDYLIEKLQGLDILLLEANHDVRMLEAGSYPYPLKRRILGERGHLSNEVSGQLLGELLHDDMKAVILGHLSKENNYAELAYETVRQEVTLGENPYKGNDFPIYVAKRNEPMPMLCV